MDQDAEMTWVQTVNSTTKDQASQPVSAETKSQGGSQANKMRINTGHQAYKTKKSRPANEKKTQNKVGHQINNTKNPELNNKNKASEQAEKHNTTAGRVEKETATAYTENGQNKGRDGAEIALINKYNYSNRLHPSNYDANAEWERIQEPSPFKVNITPPLGTLVGNQVDLEDRGMGFFCTLKDFQLEMKDGGADSTWPDHDAGFYTSEDDMELEM